MTELEVLQQIQKGIEAIVFILGAIIGFLASILFAKAWGRNTNV